MTPRLAKADEAEALARLIDAAYEPYRARGIALPDVSDGVAEAIAAGEVWVAENGKILGVLMLRLSVPDAHLMNIAVAPEGQGKGIGGALIAHAISLAKAANCAGIALATHTELPENISLYQHLGWKEQARDGMRVRMHRPL
ncbi:GNAT family N-acetyltransferase [Shimia aestuarii]|uniref:Acetyltransferase (GNAT) family protein n=1 Tax=Shimia aestuarii TaxID=254406 RepID=A0A1I4JU86_9RHOB|nr:GNAT family N-acetyltransferase [Shimia aestuarii]SFL70090.1 Acetyltransferase (GNAT) family protein [Shimia aestuarii]